MKVLHNSIKHMWTQIYAKQLKTAKIRVLSTKQPARGNFPWFFHIIIGKNPKLSTGKPKWMVYQIRYADGIECGEYFDSAVMDRYEKTFSDK